MRELLERPERHGGRTANRAGGGRRKRPVFRRLLSWLSWLLVVALASGVGVAAYAWQVDGLRYMPILTGSMSPGMPKNSLAITRPIAASSIREGQVIAFMPPKEWAPADGNPVVHRVLKLEKWVGDVVEMTTKGDNNDSADPWRINLADDQGSYAEVVKVVPHVGGVFRIVHSMGIIGLLATVLGLMLFLHGVKRAVAEIRKRRNAAEI